MKTQLYWKKDLQIKRTAHAAEVENGDGYCIYSFPLGVTDDEIMKLIDFANTAYAHGVREGRKELRAEFNNLLRGRN